MIIRLYLPLHYYLSSIYLFGYLGLPDWCWGCNRIKKGRLRGALFLLVGLGKIESFRLRRCPDTRLLRLFRLVKKRQFGQIGFVLAVYLNSTCLWNLVQRCQEHSNDLKVFLFQIMNFTKIRTRVELEIRPFQYF